MACRVEARDRLAVLIPDPGTDVPTRASRDRAAALARVAGFTHVALELGTDGAPLSRD